MTWFYFVGECVKRNNTYLHVLSSWRNQVPGSLPFLSMYARRVLQGSGNKAMCVKQGQPFCETPQCEKGPVNNLHNSIGATWHVPGKKICVSKLPMHKSSIQSCLMVRQTQGHNANKWHLYIDTPGAEQFMVQTLYFSPFVVDLSSCAK